MLRFFLDLPVDDWPPEGLEPVIEFVREHSAFDSSTGHHRFDHPEGLIVVPQADQAPTPLGTRRVEPTAPRSA